MDPYAMCALLAGRYAWGLLFMAATPALQLVAADAGCAKGGRRASLLASAMVQER